MQFVGMSGVNFTPQERTGAPVRKLLLGGGTFSRHEIVRKVFVKHWLYRIGDLPCLESQACLLQPKPKLKYSATEFVNFADAHTLERMKRNSGNWHEYFAPPSTSMHGWRRLHCKRSERPSTDVTLMRNKANAADEPRQCSARTRPAMSPLSRQAPP